MDKSTSEDLKTKIIKRINEHNIMRPKGSDIEQQDEFKRGLDRVNKEVRTLLVNLFDSMSIDTFFFDCSIGVYDKVYLERLKVFRNKFFLSEVSDEEVEISFLKTELEKLHNYRDNRLLDGVKYDRFVDGVEEFRITRINKVKYLKLKLNKLGWNFEPAIEELGDFADPHPDAISFYPLIQEDPILDYNFITKNQIVLLLDEIGFFKLEMIKDLGVGKKAEVLRFLTRGIGHKGLSDAITNVVIYSKSKDSKAVKDREKVSKLLKDIKG